MKKRVLIIGSNGQLGSDLKSNSPSEFEIFNHTRDDCDITDHEKTSSYLDHIRPQVIVNTAAFHNTDKCEEDPDLSFSVNASAVKLLAKYCHENEAVLAHISTDYVFGGGETDLPFTEKSEPNPINAYGISKLAGEQMVRAY